MLIGLMLFSSMSMLFYPLASFKNDKLVIKNDYYTIISSMDQMRDCAMLYGNSQIEFEQNKYLQTCNKQTKEFTTSSKMTTNFPDSTLSFNEHGNVNRAGTIKLEYGDELKDIIVHIGPGYE